MHDESDGRPGVNRGIFPDEALFELKTKRIWERVWIYVVHQSQLPKPKDFLTTWIGRMPFMVNRSSEGKLQAFVNSCAHRGATLCRKVKGNFGILVCRFHGRAFNFEGKLCSWVAQRGFDLAIAGSGVKVMFARIRRNAAHARSTEEQLVTPFGIVFDKAVKLRNRPGVAFLSIFAANDKNVRRIVCADTEGALL